MQMLLDYLRSIIEWIIAFPEWVIRWVFFKFMEAFGVILGAFPAPQFLTDFATYAAALTGEVWWFLNMFKITEGFSMVISALMLRFLIRRLPVVG